MENISGNQSFFSRKRAQKSQNGFSMEEGLKAVAEGMVLTGPFFDRTIFSNDPKWKTPVGIRVFLAAKELKSRKMDSAWKRVSRPLLKG